ncbi:MAG: hypothetical protein Q4G13_02145 [Moraxella sp.]|nr:hypothetical protein [Moraxella sp.]
MKKNTLFIALLVLFFSEYAIADTIKQEPFVDKTSNTCLSPDDFSYPTYRMYSAGIISPQSLEKYLFTTSTCAGYASQLYRLTPQKIYNSRTLLMINSVIAGVDF